MESSSRFLRVLPFSEEDEEQDDVDEVDDAVVLNLDVLFLEFISASINE
jgi:hypothetical protein